MPRPYEPVFNFRTRDWRSFTRLVFPTASRRFTTDVTRGAFIHATRTLMAYALDDPSQLLLTYALHTDPDPVRVSLSQQSGDEADRSYVDLTLVISNPPDFLDRGRPEPKQGGPASIEITIFDGNTPLELTSSFDNVNVSKSRTLAGYTVSGPDNEGRIGIQPTNEGKRVDLGSDGAMVTVKNVLVNDEVGTAFIRVRETSTNNPNKSSESYFRIPKFDFRKTVKLIGNPYKITHDTEYISNCDGFVMFDLSSNIDGKPGFKQYRIESDGRFATASTGDLHPDLPEGTQHVDRNSALMPVAKGETFKIKNVKSTGGVGSLDCWFIPMNVAGDVVPVEKV